MASKKKGQRKRKSAGIGDIFEVSEKDLSPEPEECDNVEPETKISKTSFSDVSESRKNGGQHNLNDSQSSKNTTENQENPKAFQETVDIINISDISASENDSVQIIEELSQKSVLVCSNENKKKGKSKVVTSSSVSDDKEAGKSKDKSLRENKSDETITIRDENDDSQGDVVMVCDNSVNISNESISACQIQNDDSLEDGEVDESTLDEPDHNVLTSDPAITIKFSDKSIADIYKHKFFKFFQPFVELDMRNVDDTTIAVFRDNVLDPKEWVVLDHTVCFSEKIEEEELAKLLPATPKIESPKKKKKKKKSREPELFVVDANPGALTHKPPITKYSTKFLIDDKKQEVEKKDISKPGVGSMCFNCGNSHALKDCNLPKNYVKINANRQKFQTKFKSTRYHMEEDQKFSHLQPGIISPNLRKALGLKKYQIPGFVYQMRRLGYPPGWLEEAKIVKSDLEMFDIDGKNVKNTSSKVVKGLDPQKVIDYPGFNVPLEKSFKDEYKYHGVPPFCDNFSKQNMLDFFKKVSKIQEDNLETQDMELDHAADDSSANMVIEDKQIDSSVESDSTSEVPLSLLELQKQKDSLLNEIKKSSKTIPWDLPSEDTSQSSIEEQNNKNEQETSETELTKETIVESESTETRIKIKISEAGETDESSSSLNTTTNINCVKHSTFGTPILKSTSPYCKLPAADNFTKGVSPVIDFENLPDSTGKYEQMTGLLQKVRTTLKSLNNQKT